MNLENIKNQLPDVVKDTKLNMERIFLSDDATLTSEQMALVALACSYQLRNADLQQAVRIHFSTTQAIDDAAKICASLMAMNNVYYRFTHLVLDKSFSSMNPMLRMSGLGNHGVANSDFELAALAVSALSGCGMCMDAHTEKLKKEGASPLQIQAAIRMAAVLNAAVVGLEMNR